MPKEIQKELDVIHQYLGSYENPINYKETLEENNLVDYMKFQKIHPRIDIHNYKEQKFYLYCYLDPFNDTILKYIINNQRYVFGYRPLYVGKATGAGYRHNQHLVEFAKSNMDIDDNLKTFPNMWKKQIFADLEKKMLMNKNPDLPSNWNEYKDNWIIIMDTANSSEELIEKEKEIINKIGTLRKRTGYLVNATHG